jgi:N-acyl homoserine lactone hydrolase
MRAREFTVTLALAAVLGSGGCDPGTDERVAAAELADAEAVRLYVFDCGHLQIDSVQLFGIEDHETDVRTLATPCYVVEHPRGRLLWDGGLPSSLAELDGWQTLEPGMRARLDTTFATQLSAMGLDTSAFDYVAFSHLHFDHVGVANELSGGTLIMQRAEHEAAFGTQGEALGFVPALYAGLRALDRELIDGDHDVFGDGRVRILSAPGHTPGHQVLYLELVEYGPLVLSGDLYHFRFSRMHRRVPVFNVDADETRRSMDRIEALVAETGAEFWIQHERAHFDTLRLAPLYYR